MILIAYRHGLHVSELINLTWAQIDLDAGRVSVRRLKNGEDSFHPISGREIRGLRTLRLKNPGARYVFVTERSAPMARNAFFKLLTKAATKAGLEDASAPAAPCLRLQVGQSGVRYAVARRLSGPSPGSEYQALLPDGQPPFRGAVAGLTASDGGGSATHASPWR